MAKLNLFLGDKCNFSCSYCLQSFKEDDYLKDLNVDTEQLVQQLSIEVKERTINKIAYWGGEPLLYFKLIKEIHEKFKSHGVYFRDARILTNGSLFTEEIVEYFNANNIYVGISIHEGFGTPKWDLIKKLNRWSTIYLYTGSNPDFDILSKVDMLENYLEHKVTPYLHWVRATDNCDTKDYFTEETLVKHREFLFSLADKRLQGNEKAYWLLQPHINKMIAKLNQNNFNGSLCINNRILTVDIYGNKFNCHHSPIKENYIGSIIKGDIELPNTNMKFAKDIQMKYVNSEECKVCPIRSWCRGNCYMSNTHDMDCKLQKIKFEVFDYILRNENNR